MDLAFGHPVTPFSGEPSCDGGQVLLQPTGEAGQLIDPAVGGLGQPRLQILAPALPDHRQKGLAQRMRPAMPVSAWQSWWTYVWASRDRLTAGLTLANDTALADGPCGRV
jgi:hypothetical protein